MGWGPGLSGAFSGDAGGEGELAPTSRVVLGSTDEAGDEVAAGGVAIGNTMDALIDFPARSTGGNYAGPSLFVVGANSNYVQPDHHATIRQLFPQASILLIPDAGHWLHAEKPAEFIDLVSRFLTGLE